MCESNCKWIFSQYAWLESSTDPPYKAKEICQDWFLTNFIELCSLWEKHQITKLKVGTHGVWVSAVLIGRQSSGCLASPLHEVLVKSGSNCNWAQHICSLQGRPINRGEAIGARKGTFVRKAAANWGDGRLLSQRTISPPCGIGTAFMLRRGEAGGTWSQKVTEGVETWGKMV